MMGWNDHINDDNYSKVEKCPKCDRSYLCYCEKQVVGFRARDEKICPYCGEILGSSMEYEFSCHKVDTNETIKADMSDELFSET